MASDLQYGKGSALWKYWTKGEGFAKWAGALHKWTTLHRLLIEAGVPVHAVDGLTTNIIQATMPGYMKQAHAKGHRSMTTTTFTRSYPLDDIRIRSGGDGRTVEAYAAVFDTPTEIRDQDGHYNEVIGRSAFDKTIAERGKKVGVFFNHGLTLHGTPSELHSMPIGVPVEAPRVDGRGVVTVTRYHNTRLADEVLEAINSGAITGQSFSGRMIQSNPRRGPYRARGGELPTVTRNEIALREYGPTPFPAYEDAAITNVRALLEAYRLGAMDLDEEELAELVRTAIPVHHTATVDTTWDAGAVEKRLDPEDDAAMKAVYAWYDSSAPDPDGDGYPDRKSDWKFPHHEVSSDGKPGAANLNGVRNALARLDGSNIPDADKAKVRAHLEAHLQDAQRSTTLPLGEPETTTDTPSQGAVTAEPEPGQGHHSGPVMTRAQARARLLKSGVLL